MESTIRLSSCMKLNQIISSANIWHFIQKHIPAENHPFLCTFSKHSFWQNHLLNNTIKVIKSCPHLGASQTLKQPAIWRLFQQDNSCVFICYLFLYCHLTEQAALNELKEGTYCVWSLYLVIVTEQALCSFFHVTQQHLRELMTAQKYVQPRTSIFCTKIFYISALIVHWPRVC